MMLLFLFTTNKLNYVVLLLAFVFIGNVKTAATNDASQTDNKAPIVKQKSVKKELVDEAAIVVITPPQEKDNHTEKLIIIGEKTVIEKVAKKSDEKETATKPKPTEPQHQQPILDEDFVLDDGDISESLKTGFYFFLILSSGAIVFIIFKIYRLRLSRAERRYGVQGDRSTQELTPLPISIEDGQSDDEDNTLFEIQRQNIRIL